MEQGAGSRELGGRIKTLKHWETVTLQGESLFRFENLEVWQRAADLAFALGAVADELEAQRRYRFAEQLRAAGLSISNNIAEGSGSTSNSEFRNYLNFARRSAFECASMIVAFQRQQLVNVECVPPLRQELSEVFRMITALSRSLA